MTASKSNSIAPLSAFGILSEEQEAEKEFAAPAGNSEASSKREGPLANSGRRLAAWFSIPRP
ncbi:MAG: hypothetical protein U5K69_18890 [Balneolaceae bacterium]|nr:hypothetical protein [Balneolaceae bacterium]